MADELKDQRIPIMMTPSEVKAVDDWMFSNRIKSRAEAIRSLVRFGLTTPAYKVALRAAIEFINNIGDKSGRNERSRKLRNALGQLVVAHELEISLIEDARSSEIDKIYDDMLAKNPKLNIDREEFRNVVIGITEKEFGGKSKD